MTRNRKATPETLPPPIWFAPREGFSARCCEYFAYNFDNAPMFVSRSEYIPVKGQPHQLKKTIAAYPGVRDLSQARRRGGLRRHPAKALRSGSLVEQRN